VLISCVPPPRWAIATPKRITASRCRTESVCLRMQAKPVHGWERSALQNNFLGQQYAAVCYLTGQGAGQDSSRGYAYLLLARDGGNRDAGELLETIRPELSAADLDRAEQIHSELRAKIDELRD